MNSQNGRIQDKVALVTGGALGIGHSIAKLFVEEGANVIIADIDAKEGEKAAEQIGATFMKLDVSNEKEWEHTVHEIVKKFGRLDILVNNAGIMGKGAQDPENVSYEQWQLVHKINLDSVFLGCKFAIQVMKEKGGSIVNMSSRSGIIGVPGAAPYASSKAAIRNHTKSVALYCAQQHYPIRCNSVHPAAILTNMWKTMLGEGEKYEENLKRMSKDIPLRRFGTPEEVAYAVLFLASPEASYITGEELNIDGGILAGTLTSPDPNLNDKK